MPLVSFLRVHGFWVSVLPFTAFWVFCSSFHSFMVLYRVLGFCSSLSILSFEGSSFWFHMGSWVFCSSLLFHVGIWVSVLPFLFFPFIFLVSFGSWVSTVSFMFMASRCFPWCWRRLCVSMAIFSCFRFSFLPGCSWLPWFTLLFIVDLKFFCASWHHFRLHSIFFFLGAAHFLANLRHWWNWKQW